MSSTITRTQMDEASVDIFCEYLRIPSVHPNIEYDECVEFLSKLADDLKLPIKVLHVHPKRPIVIITWEGTDTKKPSILLNSHMDVVPVFEEEWTYPPFKAHIDSHGDIYARGSQDMKCVGVQYLEAIRRLKMEGERVSRTIHICFVPDEEIGGHLGMKDFVHTVEFKALNVGFALDEGMASPTEQYNLFNQEKLRWPVQVRCVGNTGHGSIMLDNTAGEKLKIVLNRFMEFREAEKAKLKNPKCKLGDVTSVNLMTLSGGVQTNVIPKELTAVFDVRLPPTADHEEFEAIVKRWCEEAGPDVTCTFLNKDFPVKKTVLDDSNPFWMAFKKACSEMGVELEIGILTGATDIRYVRKVGIPALNFSPMNKTKMLAHDHDEHLNKDVFLKGIKIYTKLIPAVANV